MWSYWFQSVSIGLLWILKILCLKDFSTEGVEIPVGTPMAPTWMGGHVFQTSLSKEDEESLRQALEHDKVQEAAQESLAVE